MLDFLYLAGEVDELGNYDGGRLGVADYDQQLSEIPIRAPGTCEWLTLHPSFSEWMRSATSDLLWLRGYPGVGKSVLTKNLIMSVIGSTYVRSKRSATPRVIDVSFHTQFLVYFFCNEDNAALRSESSVLQSILHQVLLGAPLEVAKVLISFKSAMAESGGYRFFNSISALWDAIKAALVAVNWKVTYLVLDALDEMTPESLHSFTSGIRDLIDTVSPQIMPRTLKVLITSRPTKAIEQNIDPVSISVKSERDVRYLIEGLAKDLSRRYKFSEKTRVEIVTNICEKAGGMFLWASLAWEQLCQGASKESQFLANLKKAEALPANLDALYENVLNRLDGHTLSLTLQALPWLLAATRPLHTNELRFAMVLDTQADYHTICGKMVNEATLRGLCPSLIHVNERGYVSFAHSSIRDFLFHPKTTSKFRFDLRAVHEKVAVLCLQSLCLPGFDAEATRNHLQSQEVRTEDEMVDIVAQFYLLAYASANWYLHARVAGQSPAIWKCFDAFLVKPASVKLWTMLCLYDDSVPAQQGWSIENNNPPPPSIHIAVFLENTYLVEMLVQERLHNNGINAINFGWRNSVSRYRRPKLPEGGSVMHFEDLDPDMIRCLIRLGADIGLRNGRGQSPVQLAMHQRNQELTAMLIECARERDPFVLKNNTRILLEAVDETMPIVLKTILNDESVDLSNHSLLQEEPSMLGMYVTTPLEHACLFGMESIARILMTHPRMIEAQRKIESIPWRHNPTGVAYLTTLQGWGDLTCIALQNFPTNIVSDRDLDRRTILHHAAMEEWHDILELCIGKLPRSKLNIQDKNGMTALHYAAKMRNWYGSERLLDAGADAFMEDTGGRTPAHSAAEAGSDRVLRLLLDKGAIALDSLDQMRRTVLHYAATWNLTTVAESIIKLNPAIVPKKDQDGRTAAHMAALFGSAATLSLLLSTHLIDLNAPDEHGRTLLHCAVESRIDSCIDELLTRDEVALNPLDRSLKSPLDITASFKDEKHTTTLQEKLREAGCRPGLWRPRRSYGHAGEEERKAGKRKWHYEWEVGEYVSPRLIHRTLPIPPGSMNTRDLM